MVEKIFGQVLLEQRRSKNLTQEDLAIKSDLDRTYISLIERGMRQPTITTLFRLSTALEIFPEEIIKIVREKHENC